ncbi:haloacid dehalogenase [Ligilactobacillus salitolerans]|uniref:Haloacid dehalogenase n=1 Tax=Ligilactobacillus salitolerans TaxID=1808352 RepID=A0A401IUB8_9LACO|nr:Cof-type HAD-IIB family hydrolase [Ligilactobacillus salitolerans]GBG95140.1 haloacid dehalogenase [Ligilactobacillus salitolerans]
MLQLIASDMDGTMLNDHMVISDYNIAAIKHAREKGVHFIVSTGRAFKEVKPLLDDAGISCPLITLNGALVLDEAGKVLSSAPLADSLVQKIMVLLKKAGLYFEVITSKGVCSDDKAARIENFAELLASIDSTTPFKLAVSLASARLELMNINYVDDYYQLVEDPNIRIYKIVAFSPQGQKGLQKVKEQIAQNESLVITSSGSGNIEINHVNAQKGIALQAYADRLNIPLDNVMALGDNGNDLSMIQAAGISYAMENATDEIKLAANHLTAKNTENGAGLAIEEQLSELSK